jgi:hypothetical protein
MLASSIKWILVISGIVTAGGGLAALLLPQTMLKLIFGADNTSALTEFFVRHWGALLFVVCSLTIYAAYFPDTRGPILIAAIIEKAIIFFLILFGSSTRTKMMTAIAIMDGSLAILFTAYLLGL